MDYKICGNKCQCCGYNKYHGNLAFHHLEAKESTISELFKRTASWNTIIEEVNKCVLVCHNCHGEIHAGLIKCPQINHEERKKTLKEILESQPLPKTKQFHNCICGKSISITKKFCSQQCVHIKQNVIKWPDNLPELVKSSSQRAIAKALGVSDKAVEKRLKNHHQGC